jgi:hypothetical protein
MARIIKPLLVFFRPHSPANEVESNIEKLIDYDRLIFMNMNPWVAWGAAKRFTIKHRYADGFYTHIVIIDDDVSFDVDILDLMLQRIKAYNFPVMSADAVDATVDGELDKFHYYQTTKYGPPSKQRQGRTITFSDGSGVTTPIFKVSWTRCQLMIIRSDLVANVLSFRNDSIYNGLTDPEGIDHSTVLANELWDNAIDQYVDTNSKVEIEPESVIGKYYTTNQWNCYFARKETRLNIWQINMPPVPEF